ncbi:MAG: 2Fe-2S iron-sulfur cluster binding domain-containing protein [Nannocystaceae bacterium]|nr:2Fe-2S iron-sulfur cluster binding domain-containing protein [Nannocystaceae bacterium]
MVAVRRGDVTATLAAGESVLDGLARHGVTLPSSCRAGACQSCLVRAVAGTPPPAAQQGLREGLRRQGYFLACCARPQEDLELAEGDADLDVEATVTVLDRLAPDVVRVGLRPARSLGHRAGQFVTVTPPGGPSRAYSIASASDAPELELHVRAIPGGAVSGWLAERARVGDRVTLRGPAGECFYVAGRAEQPLLLAGTGTGIAPLFGLLQDALREGHRGRIVVVHGSVAREGQYLETSLAALAAAHAQLEVHHAVLQGEPGCAPGAHARCSVWGGSIASVVASVVPSPKGFNITLCGDPSVVAGMRRALFLAGAALTEIRADAFLPSAA